MELPEVVVLTLNANPLKLIANPLNVHPGTTPPELNANGLLDINPMKQPNMKVARAVKLMRQELLTPADTSLFMYNIWN